MRCVVRRWRAFLCAALICCFAGSAKADFSPRYTALTQGRGAMLTVSGRLDVLVPLSQQSLDIVNEWLAGLQARLYVQSDPLSGQGAEVLFNNQLLLSAWISASEGGQLTAFYPSGNGYLTSLDAVDALTLLAGGDRVADVPTPAALQAVFSLAAPRLYPLLGQFVSPRTVKESTSVKNALSSPAYELYQFKEAQFNEIWPLLLDDALLPAMQTALAPWPLWAQRAETLLRGAVFYGDCRVKRLLDKNSEDMGLQFTGQVESGASGKRKVTLSGGFTPGRGGTVSLSLPAVSGKNTLKFSMGGRLTSKDGINTLTLEASWSRSRNGESSSAALDGTVRNAVKNGDETWSGRITLSTAQGKNTETWTFTPEITSGEEALAGTVAVQRKTGSAVTLKATVQMCLSPSRDEAGPEPTEILDLRGMDESAARARVLAESLPLSRVLVRLMAQLPDQERWLLAHDLRTDAWMNGPSAAVPEAAADEGADIDDIEKWIVVEEE